MLDAKNFLTYDRNNVPDSKISPFIFKSLIDFQMFRFVVQCVSHKRA